MSRERDGRPERREANYSTLALVAAGRVSRVHAGTGWRGARGLVWMVDGGRAEAVTAKLLTEFAQAHKGGPYLSTSNGDGSGAAELTPAGRELWVAWTS